MMILMAVAIAFLALIIYSLFGMASKKEKWESLMSSIFECGFSSNYGSRFSFSTHFFLIGLIFLFLDLELCIFMPFLNEETDSYSLKILVSVFVMSLLLGLLMEWKEGALEWIF